MPEKALADYRQGQVRIRRGSFGLKPFRFAGSFWGVAILFEEGIASSRTRPDEEPTTSC